MRTPQICHFKVFIDNHMLGVSLICMTYVPFSYMLFLGRWHEMGLQWLGKVKYNLYIAYSGLLGVYLSN